jgi:hypothetical protein
MYAFIYLRIFSFPIRVFELHTVAKGMNRLLSVQAHCTCPVLGPIAIKTGVQFFVQVGPGETVEELRFSLAWDAPVANFNQATQTHNRYIGSPGHNVAW